jgi:hypothetical protein
LLSGGMSLSRSAGAGCCVTGVAKPRAHFPKSMAGERLIYLEIARLACLGVDMAPVVRAKGHVTVLLL